MGQGASTRASAIPNHCPGYDLVHSQPPSPHPQTYGCTLVDSQQCVHRCRCSPQPSLPFLQDRRGAKQARKQLRQDKRKDKELKKAKRLERSRERQARQDGPGPALAEGTGKATDGTASGNRPSGPAETPDGGGKGTSEGLAEQRRNNPLEGQPLANGYGGRQEDGGDSGTGISSSQDQKAARVMGVEVVGIIEDCTNV